MSAYRIALAPGADPAGFRRAVRALLRAQVPPEAVIWDAAGTADLFGTDHPCDERPVSVPRA